MGSTKNPTKIEYKSIRVGKDKALVHMAFNGYMGKNILHVESPSGGVIEVYAKPNKLIDEEINRLFKKCESYFSGNEFGIGIQHFMEAVTLDLLGKLHSMAYNKSSRMPVANIYDGQLF